MRVNDPGWIHISALASVKPTHAFHLYSYLRAVKGKFNASAYATFAGLETRHVTRMLEVFEAEGLCEPAQAATAPVSARGTRLPADFTMSPELILWAQTERSWTREVAETEATIFADYWHAQPGQKGVKVDWAATWRNWVRNSRKPNGERVDTAKPLTDPVVYKRFCQEQLERETARGNRPGILNWRRKLEAL